MSSMMSFSFVVGRERTNCEKIGCLRCPIKEWDNFLSPGDFEFFANVQTKTSWGSFGQVVFNRISQNLIPEKKESPADQDVDAVVYLMLASELVKSMRPNAVMIAEDVSGMPGLCVPVAEGCIKGGS